MIRVPRRQSEVNKDSNETLLQYLGNRTIFILLYITLGVACNTWQYGLYCFCGLSLLLFLTTTWENKRFRLDIENEYLKFIENISGPFVVERALKFTPPFHPGQNNDDVIWSGVQKDIPTLRRANEILNEWRDETDMSEVCQGHAVQSSYFRIVRPLQGKQIFHEEALINSPDSRPMHFIYDVRGNEKYNVRMVQLPNEIPKPEPIH